MERFLQRHRDRQLGNISGFDRLLFQGVLHTICYVEGLNLSFAKTR
jgi:hypothetical protein